MAAEFANRDIAIEAEENVLGSILKNPECLSVVSSILKSEYFYVPQNKNIYSTILSIDAMGDSRIDPLIVLDALRKDGTFTDAEGKEYLARIASNVPSTANVESYAKIVREKYYIRSLISVVDQIGATASDDSMSADELLDFAEQKIYDIRQGKTISGPSKIGDIIKDVYGTLYQLTTDETGQYVGIPTGFSDLDRMLTGLNKSDLVLIGARPAMGKTSFALNIARNVAGKHKKVVFFSLEMSKEQLTQRALAMEARIQSTKFRTGDLTPDEWEKIAGAAESLSKLEIYFDDTSSLTVPEMKARIRQLKDVDCVFIDYLQLMQSGKRIENRVQEVSEITRSLKLMAKDLAIPVVTCSQLARRTEEKGKSHKPQLSDLRESGSIEQDADIVMMLYREDYYKEQNNDESKENIPIDEVRVDIAQVLIQKNRHGPTGTVKLAWNPDFTLFTTLEKNYDQ